MIFKEIDCIDVAKDKKALQSSISSHSLIDDASRACRSDLNVLDYAFHTAYEDNPWWLLDLEQDFAIDCIRITNRSNKACREKLKTIKIELSLDRQTWILIDHSCFEWKHELESVDINIYQAMRARYIKVSLQAKGYLHFKKCEVFVRKIKGLALSSMSGGYGDRLISFLNAMYVAKYAGLKFGFGWKCLRVNSSNDHIKAITMADEDEIFDEDFIKKHSYTNARGLQFNLFSYYGSGKNEVKDYGICENSIYPYGCYMAHNKLSHYIKELPKDYAREFKELFSYISFSDPIKQAIDKAKITFKSHFKNKESVAIHLRSGDIVYSNIRSFAVYTYYSNKATPIEIALELIKINLNKNILLFAEDEDSARSLINYALKNYNVKVYFAKDFIPEGLSDTQIDFFEIIFMSCCKEIISPSGFARLASLIGNGEESKQWANIFSLQEQFDIFERNLNLIKTDNYQSAYSYFCYFMIAKNLNKDSEFLLELLNKAKHYDSKNLLYTVFIIDLLMRRGEYEKAQECFRDNMSEEFFGVNHTFNTINIDQYNEQEICNYPYLCFMLAKIFFFKKDLLNTKNYLNLALDKEKDNEVFLDFKNKIQVNQVSFMKQQNDQNLKSIGAAERFKNHLAYKLGQAVIENSKSFMGYIRMPYVLSYIKDKHKQEQKAYEKACKENPSLKLPSLETYTDYNEALKVKDYLSYKLGEALVKASNNAWGGGVSQIHILGCA